MFIFYISLKLLHSTTEGTHTSGDSFVMFQRFGTRALGLVTVLVSVGHLVSVAGTYKNIR